MSVLVVCLDSYHQRIIQLLSSSPIKFYYVLHVALVLDFYSGYSIVQSFSTIDLSTRILVVPFVCYVLLVWALVLLQYVNISLTVFLKILALFATATRHSLDNLNNGTFDQFFPLLLCLILEMLTCR